MNEHEAVSAISKNYQQLIEEAFLSPIKHVTVIDDEYPTLPIYLSYSLNNDQLDFKKENLERLAGLIEMCHKDKQWSIDVFDGQTPVWNGVLGYIPLHLNHSDLVILDYHLDGDASQDDGTKSRKIINQLENNNHFNIVIVHTKGNDGDINSVYTNILYDFVRYPNIENLEFSDNFIDNFETWIDANEDSFPLLNMLIEPKEVIKTICLMKSLSIKQYLDKNHFLKPFESQINEIAARSSLHAGDIALWIANKQINQLKGKLTGDLDPEQLKWFWSDEVNYICTGRVFITVINKKNEQTTHELYADLLKAFYKLDPSPMHLLLAKMRHIINENGLGLANQIISNRYAQAGWLCNFLSKSPKNILEHDKVIDIHWEQLSRVTKADLRKFSISLCEASLRENSNYKEFVNRFFEGTLEPDTDIPLGHLNAFSCSMPPISRHLTTGSILEFDDQVWVCLTPACDLVPGQRIKLWNDRIGDKHLVFKAVALKKETLRKANKESNSNDFLFIQRVNGDIDAYYVPNGKDNPPWDIFYATNQGLLSEEFTLKILGIRNRKNEVNETPALPIDHVLELRDFEAKIIAELRYAYALNFLHKLGASQSRVGLGFSSKII